MSAMLQSFAYRFSTFLRDHKRLLRNLQWCVVGVYFFLILVPAALPLPDNSAHIFSNLTIFAQFAFWGIWWPFVLVSMPLMGRAWCGWFCPEGMLTEWASEHGRGRAIPKWMRWGGWPFVAFALTTIYGQLVSVYQYPWAVLAVLGGSTAAAMVVGYLYGRNKRVWCKYLCPVNGVFQLLAKLAPWHYKVSEDAWRHPVRRVERINCAPLVPLRHMKGATDCHMCGRCADYRGAIALTTRSPEEEIVDVAQTGGWQTALIIWGLMGIAVGAFLWSASPWFVSLKQAMAEWLVNRNVFWPLEQNAPWFILTHYPQVNDVFSWLDGFTIVLFIFGTALVIGGALWLSLQCIQKVVGATFIDAVDTVAQALIPAAGAGVFLGLSATTITLLRNDGIATGWAGPARLTLLFLSLLWSLRLAWKILQRHQVSLWQRVTCMLLLLAGLAPFTYAWLLFFVIW